MKEKKSKLGLITLIICGIITIIIMILCMFFPEEVFGIFIK